MDYRREISLFCKKLNYVTTPDLWITDFKLNGNEEIVMPSSIESSFSREFKEGSNFFSYTIKEKTTPAKNYSGDMSFDDLLKDQTNTVEIVVDEITGWRILVNGNNVADYVGETGYNCENGTCVSVLNGSQYSTLAECEE